MTVINATATDDSLDSLIAKVDAALAAHKAAKGTGWRKESDAGKRLSKALTRLVNSQIGPELEARLVLYPVMDMDQKAEAKARLQEAEEKSKKNA